MAHPWHHARSSAKKFGGTAEDYLAIHQWFDQTKAHQPDARHRALLHSSFGIFLCEQVHGVTLTNSAGRTIPVRVIGEQHVQEDMGGVIPTVQDWLAELPLRPWMAVGARGLREALEETPGADVPPARHGAQPKQTGAEASE
ncbi:DUF6915 family protein [Deinococcus hohokamensis]|uniref:DUF6915 family protein n=1 Tax=Deinococcus hohokamensis TaxID=309883 RepID=A0ABV9I7U4_9DEIO